MRSRPHLKRRSSSADSKARAARKSDGRKTVSVPAPLASPCGRGGRAQRGRRGQITATSNRKMLAPSQADDVPRAQDPLFTCGDSSPKGRTTASYIGTRNGAYLYRYAPFTVLRLPLNGRHALFQISSRGCIRPYAQTNQQNRYPASTAISVNGTPMRRNSDVLTS